MAQPMSDVDDWIADWNRKKSGVATAPPAETTPPQLSLPSSLQDFMQRWSPIERYKQDITDPSVGTFTHLARGTIGAPLSAVMRGVTAMFTPEPTSSLLDRTMHGWFEKAGRGEVPGLSDALIAVPAFAADVALDPLTYMSFGGSALWNAANKMIKPMGGARLAAELSPEVIKGLVAPKMIHETLEAVAPGNDVVRAVREHVLGDGRAIYDKALENARKIKTPPQESLSTFPQRAAVQGATDPKTLDELAAHQVSLERGIEIGSPRSRFMGIPIAPDPFHILSKIVGAPFKFKDIEAARLAADHVAETGAQDYVYNTLRKPTKGAWAPMQPPTPSASIDETLNRYVGPTLNGPVVRGATHADVKDLLQHVHGSLDGIITEPNRLEEWLSKDLKGFAPADRPKAFDDHLSLMKSARAGMLKDPTTDVAAMDNAIQHLESLKTNPKFWKRMDVSQVSTRPVAEHTNTFNTAIGAVDQTLRDFQKTFNAAKSAHEQALLDKAAAVGDPVAYQAASRRADNALMDLQVAAHDAAKTFPLNDAYNAFDAFTKANASRMPYHVGAANRAVLQDFASEARKRAQTAAGLINDVESYLKTSLPTNGTEVLARTDLKALAERLEAIRPAGVPITAQQAAAARKAITSELVRVMKSSGGKAITPQQAMQAKDFLNRITDDHVGNLIDLTASLANETKHNSFVMRLQDRLNEPLSQFATRAHYAFENQHAAELRQLSDLFNHWKATLSGPMLARVVHRFIMPKVEAMQKSIFRYAGMPEDMVHTMRDLEDGRAGINKVVGGQIDDYVRKDLGKIDPLLLKSHARLDDVMNAAHDVIDSDSALRKWKTGGEMDLRDPSMGTTIRAAADTQRNKALDILKRHYNDEATSLAKVDEIKNALGAILDDRFAKERLAGTGINYRPDYMPTAYEGSRYEWAKFRRRMAKENVERAMGTSKVISTFSPSAQTRFFDNTLEAQHALDEANKVGRPLKIKIRHNLLQVLGHRLELHEKAMLMRQMAARLQRISPEGILPIRFIRDAQGASKAAVLPTGKSVGLDDLKAAGYEHLGDLVPTLRNWYAKKDLYDFMKTYAPIDQSALEDEAGLLSHFLDLSRWFKRFNTTWTFYHVPNILYNAMVADVNPVNVMKNMKYAVDTVAKTPPLGSVMDRVLTPGQRLAAAMHTHPMAKEAPGLFTYSGRESVLPIADMIAERYHPNVGALDALKSVPTHLRSGTGPFDHLIFGVLDDAVKLERYQAFRKAGLTPRQATDATLNALVDYSLRWMHPTTRRYGYTLFPFFAWHVSNTMFHLPNVLHNPRWYAIMNHFREALTEQYTGLPASMTPAALADAVATPYTDAQGNRTWVAMHTPWDSQFKVLRNIAAKPGVQTTALETAKFLTDRMWNVPFRWPFGAAMDPIARRRMEAMSSWDMAKDTLKEASWGVSPWVDMVRAMFDSGAWGPAGINLFQRTEQVTPEGKVVR
jgi:hypothetical protein